MNNGESVPISEKDVEFWRRILKIFLPILAVMLAFSFLSFQFVPVAGMNRALGFYFLAVASFALFFIWYVYYLIFLNRRSRDALLGMLVMVVLFF